MASLAFNFPEAKTFLDRKNLIRTQILKILRQNFRTKRVLNFDQKILERGYFIA